MLKNKLDRNRNLQISSQMIMYHDTIHFDDQFTVDTKK